MNRAQLGPVGGPLSGLKVLEMGAIGPAPHGMMVLGDLGADVVRVDRPAAGPGVEGPPEEDWLLRNRRSVEADLKDPTGRDRVLALAGVADVFVEGFRPGVAERLGIGPDVCTARNPRLVYARMTGWGQDGPRAPRAGHDLNYLSLTGALAAIGDPDRPPPVPLNLVGDYGGGSMLLVVGILAALLERQNSGRGQVIDVAMVDGVTVLTQLFWRLRAQGRWTDRRGANLLDGGAPFYATYTCADGGEVAVGALEPQFYGLLLDGLELDAEELPLRDDPSSWPVLRARIAGRFAERTRDDWVTVFDGTDACVTPVLGFAEAADDPHLRVRSTLVEVDGVVQAAPAPRFSRTPAPGIRAPRPVGADTEAVEAEWLRT